MAFDIESLGGGLVTGFVGAIGGVLGINRRVNKVEESKQDKTLCEVMHRGIDSKFLDIKESQKAIFEQIKSINEYIRNRGGV